MQESSHVVIRLQEQMSRVGERRIVQQQPRIDMAVRGDDRQVPNLPIQPGRDRPDCRVGRQKPLECNVNGASTPVMTGNSRHWYGSRLGVASCCHQTCTDLSSIRGTPFQWCPGAIRLHIRCAPSAIGLDARIFDRYPRGVAMHLDGKEIGFNSAGCRRRARSGMCRFHDNNWQPISAPNQRS